MKVSTALVMLNVVLLLHAIQVRSAENDTIIQVVQQSDTFAECRAIQKQFEDKEWGKGQRNKAIKNFARYFDPQKDAQFLKQLVYADKYNNAYDAYHHCNNNELNLVRIKLADTTERDLKSYRGNVNIPEEDAQQCYDITTINFISKAIQSKNLAFLKAFFDLFPTGEPDPIIINKSGDNFLLSRCRNTIKQYPCTQPYIEALVCLPLVQESVRVAKAPNILGFDPEETINASEEITQFVFEHSLFYWPRNMGKDSKKQANKPGYNYYMKKYEEARRAKAEKRKEEITALITGFANKQ